MAVDSPQRNEVKKPRRIEDEFGPPGIDGTYEGSCVVCLGGTDTGLAFTGEAEWAIAGLCVLGIPEDQATAIMSRTGCVPVGTITARFRVCDACASRAGLEVGVVDLGFPTVAFIPAN